MRIPALAFAILLASCESYGPDEFAAGLACDVREQACVEECDRRYSAQLFDERYDRCVAACAPGARTVCN